MFIYKNSKTTIEPMSKGLDDAKSAENDRWSKLLQHLAEYRDEQSFEQLFSHFAPLIKGFYLAGAPKLTLHDAEEIMQEVMCKIWRKADSFDSSKSSANTWVFTIARNARIDFLRKASRRDSETHYIEADDIWDETTDNQPFVYLTQSRDKRDVADLLNGLPSEQRDCLMKMYMEGKSHAEMAGELDLPLGTVKSRIRLGLKRLQAKMATAER